MKLSFDEWNVWFHSREADIRAEPWQVGPRLLEDVYTFEDAPRRGLHAQQPHPPRGSRVHRLSGPARQRHRADHDRRRGPRLAPDHLLPFAYASKRGRGLSMDLRIACPVYDNKAYGDVPYLDASAVLAEDGSSLVLFCVNRSGETMELDLVAAGFGDLRMVEKVELRNEDLKAVNSSAEPEKVSPRVLAPDKAGPAVLAPYSWTMLAYSPTGADLADGSGPRGRTALLVPQGVDGIEAAAHFVRIEPKTTPVQRTEKAETMEKPCDHRGPGRTASELGDADAHADADDSAGNGHGEGLDEELQQECPVPSRPTAMRRPISRVPRLPTPA